MTVVVVVEMVEMVVEMADEDGSCSSGRNSGGVAMEVATVMESVMGGSN